MNFSARISLSSPHFSSFLTLLRPSMPAGRRVSLPLSRHVGNSVSLIPFPLLIFIVSKYQDSAVDQAVSGDHTVLGLWFH